MHVELLLLRLVHILCGTFWVGSGLFSSLFLAPALASSGTNPGQLFAALGKHKLFIVMPTAAVLTIASGARLLAIASGGFNATYMSSAMGRTFAWSGLAAILAFVLSLLIVRPAAVRAAMLSAALAGASASERETLARQANSARKRGGVAGTLAVVLLVLAAAGMSIARYI